MGRRKRKEGQIQYAKEDLLWEATRRRQDYRDAYRTVFETQVTNKEQHSRWDRLWSDNYCTEFLMSGLLDPSITIDDIYTKIKETPLLNVGKIHPYKWLFNPPVMYYVTPHSLCNLDTDLPKTILLKCKIHPGYVNIKEDDVRAKLLIAIDPLASDDVILESIKTLKHLANMVYDSNMDTIHMIGSYPLSYFTHHKGTIIPSTKKHAENTLNPLSINSYMEWLNIYDNVIDYCMQNAIGLQIVDNAYQPPKEFSFKQVVPNGTPGLDFEKTEKRLRDAFRGAQKLIRMGCRIKFQPSRIQGRSLGKPSEKNGKKLAETSS